MYGWVDIWIDATIMLLQFYFVHMQKDAYNLCIHIMRHHETL